MKMNPKICDCFDKHKIPELLGNLLIGADNGKMYPVPTWCYHEMAGMIDEKEFYHSCVKMYGSKAVELGLFDYSLLGVAYRECAYDPETDDIWLPRAEDIFKEHKQIIAELIDAGFMFDDATVKYLSEG